MSYYRTARLVIAASLLAIAGCGGDSEQPPQPGAVVVSLATPNNDDGIMLVTVRGPGLSTLAPARTSYRVFSRLVSTDELRVIVQGPLAAGPLLTLQVADVNKRSAYSATITEVASTTDALRASLSGYNLTIGTQ